MKAKGNEAHKIYMSLYFNDILIAPYYVKSSEWLVIADTFMFVSVSVSVAVCVYTVYDTLCSIACVILIFPFQVLSFIVLAVFYVYLLRLKLAHNR